MTLIQVKRKTSVTVTETFRYDGAPQNVDSGLPTVVLRYPDGTALSPVPTVLDTWAGPPARTTGQYRFALDPESEVTWLDYELTGTIGGEVQTLTGRVEWVGELLFTMAAFRAMRVAGGLPFALTAVPLVTDAQIMDTRAAILEEMTQILGYSPVPRFAREYVDSGGGSAVLLVDPGVEAHHPPLSVTVNGVAQDVAGYSLGSDGILETASGYTWGGSITSGRRNVVVEYIHGTARPPGNGSHVAMLWAAAQLLPSGFSSATTVSTPDGVTMTYEPSEMGRSGFIRHTGIRDVDRWLNRHSRPVAA